MHKEDRKDAGRIIRELFAGGLPVELEGRIRGWLADSENDRDVETELAEVFEEKVELEARPRRLSYRMLREAHGKLGFPGQERAKLPWQRRTAFRVAAVLVPLVMLAGIAYLSLDIANDRRGLPVAIEMMAADGEQKRVVLPDGSEVMLNGNSRLAYTEPRSVQFSGEAYFNVAKNPEVPFVITAGDMTVRVLGTQFNLSALPDSETMKVELFTGVVEVAVESDVWRMAPGEQFRYNTVEHTVEMTKMENGLPEWISESLDFGETTLGNVLETIGWYYGKPVEVGEGVDVAQPVAITLDGTEQLETVLYLLDNISEGFEYRITNDTVRIERKQ